MSFSGIIFDLDGTLYAMSKKAKISTFLNSFPKNKHFFNFLKARDELKGKDFGDKATFTFEFEKLLHSAGVPQDYETDVFNPAFIKSLQFNRNRPEFIPFIKRCRSLGIKTAVLSDFGMVDERLTALGFDLNLFDIRASSEDFGAFKPNTRPFLEVAKALQLEPRNILMVGDRIDTDGEGARAVGMGFIQICGKDNKDFPAKMKELNSLLQNLIALPVKRLPHSIGLPLPQRMTIYSAGADICAANSMPVIIEPMQRLLIPTGLIFEIPYGYEIQIRPRSGLAYKFGITVLNAPGTIDADYRGEVGIILINLSNDPFTINRGERIAQAVFARVQSPNFFERKSLSDTSRGSGGFGHTGV
jgi:dUTP pyrophosphatase